MEATDLFEHLQAYLTCSICLGYYRDPVTVKCGHSFCTECLMQCRQYGQENLRCPECRRRINCSSDLVTNRSLQNVSITAKRLRHPPMQAIWGLALCDRHGQRKKLFCEEDSRALCDFCALAPEHKNHQVLPVETVTAKCQKKLRETQNILEEKEETFKVALDNAKRREASCKEDVIAFQKLARAEYEKMHQLLWEEEVLQMQRLKRQFGDNLLRLRENEDKLSQHLQNLQRMKFEVEETGDKALPEMIQAMESSRERNENLLLQEPEAAPLHWTGFRISGLWEMLLSFRRDITLDPATAHPQLVLSEDLKSVEYVSEPLDLPNNAERFAYALAVLGAQSFTSGKHYWEVEVGDKTEWVLGICEDSVSRKAKRSALSEDIRILAGSTCGNYFFLWNSQAGFQVSPPVHKVGIFLNYERGQVAFYNALDTTLICSPPEKDFKGRLRPYFSPCIPTEESTPGSLVICPRSNH